MSTISNRRLLIAIQNEYKKNELARLNTTEQFKSYYSKKYDSIPNGNTGKKWDKLNSSKINSKNDPMAWDRVSTITRLVKIHNPKTVLNVGFGSGILEDFLGNNWLSNRLWEGFDISEDSVKKAQKAYKGSFKKMNIHNFRPLFNYYDLIISMEVFEHIPIWEILPLIKKTYQSLRKGGRLIISIPVNEGLENMLLSGNNPNSHTRIYSIDTIKMELKLSGYEVDQVINLSAFKRMYKLKSFLNKFIPIKSPNNLIIAARKK